MVGAMWLLPAAAADTPPTDTAAACTVMKWARGARRRQQRLRHSERRNQLDRQTIALLINSC